MILIMRKGFAGQATLRGAHPNWQRVKLLMRNELENHGQPTRIEWPKDYFQRTLDSLSVSLHIYTMKNTLLAVNNAD